MKQFSIFLLILFFIVPHVLTAQEIIYSDFNSKDSKDMNFEILGKMNDSYIIYKNLNWKHMLSIYDNDMHIKNTIHLNFVPEKTFNIDFITYPDHFYMIYQYQKNKTVYCMGVNMAADGKKITEPVRLDSTKIPVLTDNKIYNTIYSQDKQKIMVYKIQQRNQMITMVTKLFDADLKMLDSTRTVTDFDFKRDIYKDLFLDNAGNFVFARGRKDPFKDNLEGLEILCRRPGAKDFKILKLNLDGKFIDEAVIKIDNLNKHYIVNSFFYTQQHGNIKGLFTMLIDAVGMDTLRSVFNVFPDSLRAIAYSEGQFRAAFDDFFIRQAIVKKDGGFILTTEDYYYQDLSNANSWSRSNYLYSSPYSSFNDYYYNPAYGYYRPVGNYNNWQSTRYYYENILILSLDKDLKLEWGNIINKTQADDDNDNFLSFSTMNVGSEIHFLYNEENRNRQIISNQSISANGQLKHYPTLKSREAGYEFMARHAKQISYREVIIPCVYRANIAFAKVIFSE